MTDRELMQQALATREEKIVINTKVNYRFCTNAFSSVLSYATGSETMFYVVHQAIKRVTTPPRREWVGLTDEEKAEILSLKWWDWEDTFDIDGFIRAIEAKLKEKNA